MTRAVGLHSSSASLLAASVPIEHASADATPQSSGFRQLMEQDSALEHSDEEPFSQDSQNPASSARDSQSGNEDFAYLLPSNRPEAPISRAQTENPAEPGKESRESPSSHSDPRQKNSGSAAISASPAVDPHAQTEASASTPQVARPRTGDADSSEDESAGDSGGTHQETARFASASGSQDSRGSDAVGDGDEDDAAADAPVDQPAQSTNPQALHNALSITGLEEVSEAEALEKRAMTAQDANPAPGTAKARPAANLLPSQTASAQPSDAAASQLTAALTPLAEPRQNDDAGEDEASTDVMNTRKANEARADWNVEDETSGPAPTDSSAPVAFEATLSPMSTAPAGDSLAQSESGKQSAAAVVEETDNAAPAHAISDRPDNLFKTEALAAGYSTSEPSAAATRPAPSQPAAPPSAAHLEPMIEAPSAPASRHTISVNLADAGSEAGVNLRFVERGGEIHVSVRSADAGLAQDLRGGLSELTRNLEHAGIRAEIAAPVPSGATAGESNMQREAQQNFSDQRGSSRQPSDSQREQQEPRHPNPSRWRQAYAESAAENSSQEQPQ